MQKLRRYIQTFTIAAITTMAAIVVVSTTSAATLTSGNDYITTLQTAAAANHELIFTTPSGVAEGETITLTFSSSFDTSSITEDDIDVLDDGTQLTTAANCSGSEEASVAIASDVITVTLCAGDGGAVIGTSAITIRIGSNATSSGTGSNQITNPSSAGTYFVTIGGTFGDSGSIALPIGSDDSIDVTATVPSSSGSGGESSTSTPATTDTTAPAISNILISSITEESATLTWNTDEAATAEVNYGITEDFSDGTLSNTSYFTSHSETFSGLNAGTTYFFQITVSDSDGNTRTSSTQTFETIDETAPVISDVAVSNITTTSAVVTWTTDEEANSEVFYGESDSYGSVASDSTQTTSHSVTLTGLTAGTEYHFQVRSTDASANQASSTDDIFETDEDPAPANVSDLSATATSGQHTLTWTNPADEDLAGIYGLVCPDALPDSVNDTDCTGSDLGLVETYINSGTTDGTTYYYGIFAYDEAGQFASGALVSAMTSASEEEVPSDDEETGGGESPTETPDTDVDEDSDTTQEEETSSDDASTGSADTCGDNVCSESESSTSCPVDCEAEEDEPTSLGAEVDQLSDADISFTVTQGSIDLPTRSGVVDVLPTSTLMISVPASEIAANVSTVQLTIDTATYLMRLDDALALYEAVITVPDSIDVLDVSIEATNEDGTTDSASSYLNVITEGMVYQVIDGEEVPVTTATVTLFIWNGSEFEVWDGSPYGQFNPTSVSSNGTFAWYVPNGTYYVQGEADGFDDATTAELIIANAIIRPQILLSAATAEEDVEDDSEQDITPTPSTETPDQTQTQAQEDEPTLIQNVLKSAPVVAVQQTLETIREVPGVEEAAEISTPTLAVTAGASVVVLSVAFDFLPFLQYLFTAPILFFWRRRRKGHGTVYNAISKTPIDLAVVRLYEYSTQDEAAGRHGRLVKSRVTDRGGRYFFLVSPGRYLMKVSKAGFQFPTDYLKDEKTDGQFLDVYHGEVIEVSDKEATITANIPMDPSQAEKYREPKSIIRRKMLRKIQHVVAVSGVVAAVIFATIRPTPFSIAMVFVQIGVYMLARRLAKPQKPMSWGIVYNKETGRPLSKVVARIFEPKYDKLLETQITDSKGRYAFMLGPNQYYAVFEKEGFEPHEIKPIDYTNAEEPQDFSAKVPLESRDQE